MQAVLFPGSSRLALISADDIDLADNGPNDDYEHDNDSSDPIGELLDAGGMPVGDENFGTQTTAEVVTHHSTEPDWSGVSYEKFRDWCEGKREWIEIGINFALNNAVMSRVLRNINAPYNVWVTIRRSLIKCVKFYTRTYRTCQGHALLLRTHIENQVEQDFEECVVCAGPVLPSAASTFEYLPIKSRITK